MTTNPQLSVPEAFATHFGKPPQIVARAPGRVNIIGEHTDYNNGFVLPAALDRAVYIAASPRDDDQVNVLSLDYTVTATTRLGLLHDDSLHEATLYPRGVLALLQSGGTKIKGVDLAIGSDIPIGAGLSSSAAVGVAMLEVACKLFNIQMTQPEKARMAQRVENEFIGAPTGIMDQMASACGKADHALLIDCRSLDTQLVPVPTAISLLVLDTSTRHDHATGDYGVRRQQCEEAARLLGVASLRDVTPEQLAARADDLPEVIERRAAHVVNENVRTLACVEALKTGDLETVGRLLNESHVSLSQLFEVSNRELDIMAGIAQQEEGCYGARMMGGGFGGAVIAAVRKENEQVFAERVEMAYNAATHLKAYISIVHPGDGSGLVKG
jgi:galactokinase